MKENTKRYSLAFLITLISLLALVPSASATAIPATQPIYSGIVQPISPFQNIIYPHASFTYWPNDIWSMDTVHFYDKSTSVFPIRSWSWDYEYEYGTLIGQVVHFSDMQNPTHCFSPGVYKIKLTVINSLGKTSATSQYITIHSYEITSPYYKQPY